jgi:hypothetical protein
MSQSKLVGVVETAVHGCRGFHVRLDPNSEMPNVGTPLYAAPQPHSHIVDANKMVEPFGYFRPEPFGWTDCAETDEGAIPLYEHPHISHAKPENQADHNNGVACVSQTVAAQCRLDRIRSEIEMLAVSDGSHIAHRIDRLEMLFHQPIKREPLTDEQIDKLRYQSVQILRKAIDNRETSDLYLFARLIERAHGIGGES